MSQVACKVSLAEAHACRVQITTDDLKDDFGLLGMGSPGRAAAAKKQLLRMQEVIEGVGAFIVEHSERSYHSWSLCMVDPEARRL